jgi:alpha-mannosidase
LRGIALGGKGAGSPLRGPQLRIRHEQAPTHSFCSLGAENLVITAVKKAERDNAIALRAVEMDGVPAETSVNLLGRKGRLGTVNLLEEEVSLGEKDTLRLKPCEISTVRVLVK